SITSCLAANRPNLLLQPLHEVGRSLREAPMRVRNNVEGKRKQLASPEGGNEAAGFEIHTGISGDGGRNASGAGCDFQRGRDMIGLAASLPRRNLDTLGASPSVQQLHSALDIDDTT